MKKYISYVVSFLVVSLICITSCQTEKFAQDSPEFIPESGKIDSDGMMIKVVPAIPLMDGEQVVETKSNFPNADNVLDLNIVVFSQNQLVSQKYYSEQDLEYYGISAAELFLNNGHSFNDNFDVYLLANVGDLSNEAALRNKTSLSSYTKEFSALLYDYSQKGFPMAATYENYCPVTSTHTLEVKRLLTEYRISFSQSSSNTNIYELVSASFHDCAKKVKPFGATPYGISTSDPCIDTFETFDLDALNSNNHFYVLENVHGSAPLKSGFTVTSYKQKTQDNLKSGYREGRVSYLEMEFKVSVISPEIGTHHVIYRYYMGSNLNDFSVYRNQIVNLNINFDDINVNNEGWRQEPVEFEYMPHIVGADIYCANGRSDYRWWKMDYEEDEFGGAVTSVDFSQQEQLKFKVDMKVKTKTGSIETWSTDEQWQDEIEWTLDIYKDGVFQRSIRDGGNDYYYGGNSSNDSKYDSTGNGCISVDEDYSYVLNYHFDDGRYNYSAKINVIPVKVLPNVYTYEYVSYAVTGPRTENGYILYDVSATIKEYVDGSFNRTITVSDRTDGCFDGYCTYNGINILSYTADIVYRGTYDGCDNLTFPVNDSGYDFTTLRVNVSVLLGGVSAPVRTALRVAGISYSYDYVNLPLNAMLLALAPPTTPVACFINYYASMKIECYNKDTNEVLSTYYSVVRHSGDIKVGSWKIGTCQFYDKSNKKVSSPVWFGLDLFGNIYGNPTVHGCPFNQRFSFTYSLNN